MTPRTIFLTLTLSLTIERASAQNSPLRFKQDRNDSAPRSLTAAEFATLGDPFFNLVLKNKANLTKLQNVEEAIQPDAAKRRLFVVEEHIVSDKKEGGRRAVIAFTGDNGEPLKGNVMLSLSFGPNGFPNGPDIEAWGWDNHRNRYNYYRFDRAETEYSPTWKLRDTSDRADLLTSNDRKGTCLQCHMNGAPVMKELFFPWNNWNSGQFKAQYLIDGSGHASPWSIAADSRFKGSLDVADKLETDFMVPAIRRFNTARLNSALKRDDDTGNRTMTDGRLTVLEGKRVLRPLFETTEINLISSRNRSGRHPFVPASDFVPTLTIRIPDNFFLNTHLIAGSGGANLLGLQLRTAASFGESASLSQQENNSMLDKFKVQLNGVRGDANFAWFVPEPSLIDNDLVDQLLHTGVITPHFLAAVLAVDLEKPVFSEKRKQLDKYIPNQFEFTPVTPNGTDPNALSRDAASDRLTQAVLAAINEDNPPPGSPANEFRTLLSSSDAREQLAGRVQSYVNRVKEKLAGSEREAELERLYRVLLKRRKELEDKPEFAILDETGGRLLLPLATVSLDP